ncbi:hypothetical protein WISP_81831 [Willisornis vidua]|uniref:Uncharacterized protein n=1 Tax=Willisornis vidua TaxID=1566151 RepID=A0ABQ9D493_9PASS|nr:hypothetical protein WISP_81831 [Willisornis vidua]
MVEELCHQEKELQEKVNRLHSIQTNKQEVHGLFSEMLQPLDSQESRTSTVVEKQVDTEPFREINQRKVSQGSVKDEGWKPVSACTIRKIPPPSQNLTRTFYKSYKALKLEDFQLTSKSDISQRLGVDLMSKEGIGLAHSNEEAIEFKISWKEEKCQQNLNSRPEESRLQTAQGISNVSSGKTFLQVLGSSSLVTFQTSPPKGAGNSQMLEVK